MERPLRTIAVAVVLAASLSPAIGREPDWTRRVRIGGNGLEMESVDSIVRSAQETGVFGIEVDNDPNGVYRNFLNPGAALDAMRAVARKAHEARNRVFSYTAGLECITNDADGTRHTLFKDHADWVQRDVKGNPAIFGSAAAFWIAKGDEDVWISPFSPDWRRLYMQRIREMASTGIDGVYVDIPYWMTHFDGWEDTWASFDDGTVAEFRKRTGLDARKDLKLGRFDDPNFLKWADFRIDAITEFMAEIAGNVKAVNPECRTIAEIYPGYGAEAVSVGADVYRLYEVCDVITHETNGGEGNSAMTSPAGWFAYMASISAFRAFAGNKPTWMLSYSWDRGNRVPPQEPMKNLAMAEVMAGANCWDARGHGMSGSNDYATRKEIYGWIARHERRLYAPRLPVHPVGVYFSPSTRNYFPDEHADSFTGILCLLMQSQIEFQVVIPRTLSQFEGEVLILPDVKILSTEEMETLRSSLSAGRALVLTGETGRYDGQRRVLPENPLHRLLGIRDSSRDSTSDSPPRHVYSPECPGRAFLAEMKKNFSRLAYKGQCTGTKLDALRTAFCHELLYTLKFKPAVEIRASPFVVAQPARVDGRLHVFIANFKGLKANAVANQIPEQNVRIFLPARQGERAYCLPFLGQPRILRGKWSNGTLSCVIPRIDKGTIVWVE